MDKGRQRRLGCAVILLLVLLGIVLGVMSCRRGRQTTETAEIGGGAGGAPARRRRRAGSRL